MAPSTSKIKLDPVRALFVGAWRLYKGRFAVATQIIALPVLLRLLAYVLAPLPYMQATAAVIIFVWWLVSFVSTLALISAFGRGTSLDESYRVGLRLFWPAFFIGIVTFFITLGGLIMLVIPGIMLMVWLGFANYALVMEGRHGFNALMQSRTYVRGYWWAVFWRMLLLVIAVIVFALLAGILLVFLLGSLAGLLVELFVVPFAVAFSYRLYENLRALKPDAAAQKVPAAGKDFLVVSMIVGIVVLVCVSVLGIFFGNRVESSFESKLVRQYQEQYANMHLPAANTSTPPGVPSAGGPI